MRWNCPPIAAASDFTASVFASPGTPSTSRWPPDSSPIAIRSSRTSCPTMVRLTSNRTCSRGFVGLMVIEDPPRSLVRRSYLGPVSCSVAAATAGQGSADRHGERDTGERVVAAGVGDRDDDADDVAL